MSKRKNPLQNLDKFLKQEASSFVQPKRLSDQEKTAGSTDHEQEVFEIIEKLAVENNNTSKKQFLLTCLKFFEAEGIKSSREKLFVNTILYLLHEDQWEEKVKEYWSSYQE